MPNYFIPKTEIEISKKIKDHVIAGEIAAAFLKLKKKFPTISNPIIMDTTKPTNITVTRKVQTELNLKKFEKQFSHLTLSFGEVPKRVPVRNKGIIFEQNFARDIRRWWNGQPISSGENKEFIEEMAEFVGLKKWTELYVDHVGGENTARPLVITDNSITISPGLSDIGSTISDITLRKGSTKSSPAKVYLSLKYSKSVAFFNTGTKKYITDAELESGLIENAGGLALINMFGINNGKFCAVFNKSLSKSHVEDTTKYIDRNILEGMIKSGIGYGYHMVHKIGTKFIYTKVNKQYRDSASHVKSVNVYYGGKGGAGNRVDIEVLTPKYLLKFNFRNKNTGGRYVSHLMCNYKYV